MPEHRPHPRAPGLRGFLRAEAVSALGIAPFEHRDLEFLFDFEPPSWLRRVPRRCTFAWPDDGAERLIVKRFRGESTWRDGWYERLRGRAGRCPGQREFENLEALAAGGVAVPRAVGWAARGERSLVAMEHVAHARTLRELAGDARDSRRWLGGLVELVSGLHAAGWYHRDLYLQHFLVPAADARTGPVLIDVGRARRERAPRRRWFVKDVGALLFSAPEGVPASTRLRFLAAYLDARGVRERSQRRRWAREVEARRRRIAAHRPRWGESPPG